MKNIKPVTIIAAALLLAVGSCKKGKDTPEFTPTDVTGTTVVSGNVDKRVIVPDGAGGWTSNSTARMPAQNVNVAITISKSSLYPNSNAQGADVYRTSTDANGNFSLPVKTNAGGVTAMITIEGFTGTLDTLVNGAKKTGASAIFQGTTTTMMLYMGQNVQLNYTLNQQTSGNPGTIQTGTATVTGSVSMNILKETTTGTVVSVNAVNFPVPIGHKVYLKLENDPSTFGARVYETTTDMNGNYTFNVNTVASGTTGFPQDVTIWVDDYATTRDTLKANNTRATGLSGVFQKATVTRTGVFNNSIKNAVYVRYATFVPN
jgi:hypothetical protein